MITIGESNREKHRLLFTGDSMLISDFWKSTPMSESICASVSDADFAMTNLEAPIASGDPRTKWGPVLNTDEESIELISSLGFDAASLANNHMLDYGFEGADMTESICRGTGLDTTGIGATPVGAVDPIRTVIEDTSIAVFSVAQREFGISDGEGPGAAWSHHPETIRAIESESSRSDIVIVNAHGGLEHIPVPPLNWIHQLRAFVDAGADAVIGHHPHVAQGWETRDDSIIWYSLGNWLAHQSQHPGTHWSYFVEIFIGNQGLDHAEITLIEQRGGILQKMAPQDRQAYKQYLVRSGELGGDSAIWQAISVQLFKQEYGRRLSDWSNSWLGTLISEPIWAIDRLTRGIFGGLDRTNKDLSIVNYLQNESHSEAIRTALKLRSGTIPDERTPEVDQELEHMFEFVTDTSEDNISETMNRRIKTVIQRIKR